MGAASGPLAGVRAVDLADVRGALAGRILADLGAEVVAVEPPGGSPLRALPPFEGGTSGPSLYWLAMALGKRSVVLDLETSAGRAGLRDLLAEADLLIESGPPGELDRLGVDARAANPGLIHVSITPFGVDGPEAERPASDLTVLAAGGLLALQGDRDRPPLPAAFPQAFLHAGAQAAADAAIALAERARSGLGQHLDVSAQAAVVWTLMNATGYPPALGVDPPGAGDDRGGPRRELVPGLTPRPIAECADGNVSCNLGLPGLGARTLHALARWAEAEGALDPDLCGRDWSRWPGDVRSGALAVGDVGRAIDAVARFVRTRSKAELQAHAIEHGIVLAPVYTARDLLADPHLAARGYWTRVGGRVHPGPFAKLSRTPISLRPAPERGEGQELVERARGAAARGGAAARASGSAPRESAFSGLKVADFAWVGVGPMISKALADHGATVVHVESSARLDVLRLLPPFKDGERGIDRSQFMANFNTSKLGVALDLSTDGGRELARRLADWADVVVESFTPGTMKKFGLDYATLARDRSDLVMLSTCLRGQTGPECGYAGFGGQGAALAGLHSITGWPDRAPSGPWGAYTDFISPRFGVAALAAALLHRARTGEGQHIDLAQTECGIRFLEPLALDFAVNGSEAGGAGHDSPYACPHGVFATAGTERYLALAVETAGQWRALRAVAPLGDFAAPELDALDARLPRKREIEDALRAWLRDQDRFEASHRLARAGVPAYAVLRPSDLYRDAQLDHRGFFVTLDHREMGSMPYDGPVTRFSATPARLRSAAPCLGQHTREVLRDLLGMTGAEIERYAAAGVLA